MPNDGEPPQRTSLRQRLARLIAGGPEPETVSLAPAEAPAAIRLRLKEFETASGRDVMTSRVDIAAVSIDASLGVVLEEPFLQLAFLCLPVIPHLKITDFGMVDVDLFEVIP